MGFVKRGDAHPITLIEDEQLNDEKTKKALEETKERVSKEGTAGNNSELVEKN